MEPSMRHRRPKLFALALVLFAAIGAAAAQDFAFGWNPRTGDDWMDERLTDINGYGYRYREAFIDEIVRYHGAPRDLVFELVVDRRWAPGDVYYACAIARIVGRPCRYVVDAWNRDHGQGWGEVAKRLGIEPGSDEFHRLKRGFVPSYDRWNRPVELDAELRRAYPDRGKDRPYAWSENEGKARSEAAPAQGKGAPVRRDGVHGKDKGKGKDKP
jgi:hypothetical protein